MHAPARWLAALLLASLSTAYAATYYVDNKIGRDSFDGLSAQPGPNSAGPFATIQAATALLGAGDALCLANTGKPYTESIILFGFRGTPERPLIIEGNGAVITGLRRLDAKLWAKQADGTYLCPLKGRPYGSPIVLVDGKRLPTPARKGAPKPGTCTWTKAGLFFNPPDGKAIGEFQIDASLLVSGLLASSSSYVVCRNLTSEYHSNDGYNIHGECRGFYFEHIEGRFNGDDGFSIHETIGAVVRGGYFHDNTTGVQDVNASRTILNGVCVERNTLGFSMVGGFHSLVDCIARDNTVANADFNGNTPKHLVGSAFNPMCKGSGYIKNLVTRGGPVGLRVRRGGRVMAEHCVFTGSGVGVQVLDDAVCHLTASVVADCGKLEIEARSKNFFRDFNVYFPGRFLWDNKPYGPEQFDAFRQAAGHDEHSVVGKPVFVERAHRLAADSAGYKLRPRPGVCGGPPTPSLRAVTAVEAEAMTARNARVVEVGNGAKAVELAAEGAAVWTTVKLEPGRYEVLAMAQSLDMARAYLAIRLAGRSAASRCVAFSWYAPRCKFEIAHAGQYKLEIAWKAGRVQLDRVTIAQVAD